MKRHWATIAFKKGFDLPDDLYRWLEKRVPHRVIPYLVSLAALVLVTAFFAVSRAAFGARSWAGIVSLLIFLVVYIASAWSGYGPGLMLSALTIFVIPKLLATAPRSLGDDLRRFAFLSALSIIISFISGIGRKKALALEAATETLSRQVHEHSQEALRTAESLREQAQLLDLAHDAIISLDWDGTVHFWNQGAAKLYGWPVEEALGKNVHQLLKTEFPEPLESIQERLAATGYWEGELGHVRQDGGKLRVTSRWASRLGPSGGRKGYLEINTDITEKRRIDEQLRHTQRLESLGILAGGVAHDFNNLLTGILGNASLAQDTLPPHHPNRALLDEVMKGAERAADLTRQLLAYAGKGQFVMRTLDLSDMVREIAGLVRASIPKHVNLRLQLGEQLPGIDADAGQLQQVIMNLVINGAEAIPSEGGSVLLQTGAVEVDEQYISTMSASGELLRAGRYVTLEVHDSGVGMDEDTVRKIFDPFFTTKFAGRGLGLSAVLGIVRSHRGALKVYTKPGRGTTFKVLLPASAKAVLPELVTAGGSLMGTGTVFIVDDEELVRQAAQNTLERYGYTVVTFADGPSALEKYRKAPEAVALVMLDLTMPVMSGEAVLRELQATTPQVRVLLTSGYNEMEAVQRFPGKGLAGFIQKPFTAAALAEKVKEVMQAGRGRVAGSGLSF